MTLNATEEVSPPPRELGYSRTIDRDLVHRSAVSEVFLTDLLPVHSERVWCAAQLPLTHSYYSDHEQAERLFDPLLLLEACRQAAIAGSHSHMGIPDGTTMIVDTFAYENTWLPGLAIGDGPGELGIDTTFVKETVARTGRLRRGNVTQRLFVDGIRVGLHTMGVSFLKGSQAAALRQAQRGTPAPLTSTQPQEFPAAAAAPGSVGRGSRANVVLSRPSVDPDGIRAEVTPWFGNRSLFDHSYDHYPAMTLVEAARQTALLATRTAEPARHFHPTCFRARFLSYAELDAPLQARTAHSPAGERHPRHEVSFTQSGRTVAEITVVLGDLSAPGARS
ncbi:AfsA-related hotdog domain-containing protein [Nocardiopsis terrae]